MAKEAGREYSKPSFVTFLNFGQSKITWGTDGLLYVGLSQIIDVADLAMVGVALSQHRRDPENYTLLKMRLEEVKRLVMLAAVTLHYYTNNTAEFDTTLLQNQGVLLLPGAQRARE